MTYEPDEFMSQPDGKIILEEHIKYVKDENGGLVKKTVTRQFFGEDDYVDSHHHQPLSKPDW